MTSIFPCCYYSNIIPTGLNTALCTVLLDWLPLLAPINYALKWMWQWWQRESDRYGEQSACCIPGWLPGTLTAPLWAESSAFFGLSFRSVTDRCHRESVPARKPGEILYPEIAWVSANTVLLPQSRRQGTGSHLMLRPEPPWSPSAGGSRQLNGVGLRSILPWGHSFPSRSWQALPGPIPVAPAWISTGLTPPSLWSMRPPAAVPVLAFPCPFLTHGSSALFDLLGLCNHCQCQQAANVCRSPQPLGSSEVSQKHWYKHPPLPLPLFLPIGYRTLGSLGGSLVSSILTLFWVIQHAGIGTAPMSLESILGLEVTVVLSSSGSAK